MKEVKFTDTALKEMHAHLVACYPHEGCGLNINPIMVMAQRG